MFEFMDLGPELKVILTAAALVIVKRIAQDIYRGVKWAQAQAEKRNGGGNPGNPGPGSVAETLCLARRAETTAQIEGVRGEIKGVRNVQDKMDRKLDTLITINGSARRTERDT
jgi:hypothetical protein